MVDLAEIVTSSKKCKQTFQSIFGIGLSTTEKILKRFGVSCELPMNLLPATKLGLIKSYLNHSSILENRLRYVEENFYRKSIANNSYKGIRLSKGLPVRGQRTHSNASTAKRLKLSNKYKN